MFKKCRQSLKCSEVLFKVNKKRGNSPSTTDNTNVTYVSWTLNQKIHSYSFYFSSEAQSKLQKSHVTQSNCTSQTFQSLSIYGCQVVHIKCELNCYFFYSDDIDFVLKFIEIFLGGSFGHFILFSNWKYQRKLFHPTFYTPKFIQ